MKVIYDLWNNINGYGEPQKDLIGCLGLDMTYGQGVCRNIADDVARKLNFINPDYNAHLIVVQYDNIESVTSVIPFNNQLINQNIIQQSASDSFIDSYNYPEYIGNHAVILMDIPENNVKLIVDPTNPSLGVYVDGEIHLFNKVNGNNSSITRNFLGDTLVNGFDGFTYPIEYFDSCDNDCTLTFEELDNLYGVDAQFDALAKIDKLEVDWCSINNNDNKTTKNTNSFKNSLLVSEKDLVKTEVKFTTIHTHNKEIENFER